LPLLLIRQRHAIIAAQQPLPRYMHGATLLMSLLRHVAVDFRCFTLIAPHADGLFSMFFQHCLPPVCHAAAFLRYG